MKSLSLIWMNLLQNCKMMFVFRESTTLKTVSRFYIYSVDMTMCLTLKDLESKLLLIYLGKMLILLQEIQTVVFYLIIIQRRDSIHFTGWYQLCTFPGTVQLFCPFLQQNLCLIQSMRKMIIKTFTFNFRNQRKDVGKSFNWSWNDAKCRSREITLVKVLLGFQILVTSSYKLFTAFTSFRFWLGN